MNDDPDKKDKGYLMFLLSLILAAAGSLTAILTVLAKGCNMIYMFVVSAFVCTGVLIGSSLVSADKNKKISFALMALSTVSAVTIFVTAVHI